MRNLVKVKNITKIFTTRSRETMQSTPQELLKQYVQSQHFTSTADIMLAIKELFRDIIQQVIEV